MANSRNRGNGYERTIAKELRELGYKDAVTSRAESRNMDARKVDIFTKKDSEDPLPVHIQCKNTKDNFKVAEFYNENEKILPKDKPVVIFHKKTKKSKTNFIEEGQYVYMKKSDFYDILVVLKQLQDAQNDGQNGRGSFKYL